MELFLFSSDDLAPLPRIWNVHGSELAAGVDFWNVSASNRYQFKTHIPYERYLAMSEFVDPQVYFKEAPCFESMVLSFCRREDKINLVLDWAWDFEVRPRGQREFRRLCFEDVSDFVQLEDQKPSVFEGRYQADDIPPAALVVTHELISESSEGRWQYTIWCDRLGVFRFEFQTLAVESRIALYTPDGKGDCDYYDIKDGAVVDFYRPFGGVCDEVH